MLDVDDLAAEPDRSRLPGCLPAHGVKVNVNVNVEVLDLVRVLHGASLVRWRTKNAVGGGHVKYPAMLWPYWMNRLATKTEPATLPGYIVTVMSMFSESACCGWSFPRAVTLTFGA